MLFSAEMQCSGKVRYGEILQAQTQTAQNDASLRSVLRPPPPLRDRAHNLPLLVFRLDRSPPEEQPFAARLKGRLGPPSFPVGPPSGNVEAEWVRSPPSSLWP